MAAESLDYKATGSYTQRINYLKLAESAYLQAIKLDNRYTKALYGLGVLYIWELDKSEEAIPYLERFLQVQTRDTNAMFVLARAYYMNYEFEKAGELYDRIIKLNPNAEKVSEAEKNKKAALDALYSN